jgi:hypothetical protein
MIVFDVTCANEHTFEGWFKDGATFDAQVAAAEVACPVCGDTNVRKGLAAPRLGGLRKGKADPAPVAAGGAPDPKIDEYVKALHALKKHVEENSDYVGEKFPEEARKIHYGETEARAIYGEASPEEAEALHDEGVEFQSIPWPGKPDA